MSSKIFVINRGDTFSFKIKVIEKAPYRLSQDSKIYFGLMLPLQRFEEAVVKKSYNWEYIDEKEGTLIITLNPLDTLTLTPGVYYYSIKNHLVDKAKNIDEVHTLVKKTKFIIND